MSRVEAWFRVLLLVAATFFATEWVHYRLGAPPIFELLLGSSNDSNSASGKHGHDPDNVTESEFQTYLRVLEAMQADRSLSIDSAVAGEQIALDKFRELEQRVQRNESLIDRARHILREKAEILWNARGARLEQG